MSLPPMPDPEEIEGSHLSERQRHVLKWPAFRSLPRGEADMDTWFVRDQQFNQSSVWTPCIITPETPILRCVVCKRKKAIVANRTLCKKCRTSRFDDPIIDIPMEVFVSTILPYMMLWGKHGLSTIINCSRVNKSMHTYFNDNSIWKYIYVQRKSWDLMDDVIWKSSRSKKKNNPSIHWSQFEITNNPCKLVIKNMTDDIPYMIYYASHKRTKVMGHIYPGESYIAKRTYANHKWLCFPSRSWWMKNPYSNVGFSFVIDPFNLSNHAFSPNNVIPAYVREIRNPRTPMKPLKGIDNNYTCFKHKYMKIMINPTKLNDKLSLAEGEINIRIKANLQRARERMRQLEHELSMNERNIRSSEYTKKIINS